MIGDLGWQRVAWWLGDLGLVLVVCLFLFFRGLGASPFYDKQEAREALVIWEIHNSGNWILPLRNGNEIPAKPPFFHWLGAVVSNVMGRTDELTTRLPSALLGTLGVLLTYLTGVVLWGRSAGLISALVLATSVEWEQNARATRVDMALTFALVCCFIFFYYLYRSGGGWLKAALFGFFLGLATLSKGPLGFVVPCFAALLFLLMKRDLSFLKRMHPITIMAVCAAVAGSWYLLAFWQGGQQFLSIVIKENFNTVIGKEAGHPHPFWWYLPYLFQKMAPWSLFFPSVGLFLYRYRRELAQQQLLYFLVWFGAVLIFFSLFKQKRPVYILSAYPAIALLFGAWWQKLMSEPSSPGSLWLTRAASYLTAASYLLLGIMLFIQIKGKDLLHYFDIALGSKDQSQLVAIANVLDQHQLAVLSWSAVCVFGAIFLLLAAKRNAWGAFMGAAMAVGITSLTFVQTFDTRIAKEYTFKPFMKQVASVVNDEPLYFYGIPDYPIVFYAARHIPRYQPPLKATPSFYILFWERDWKTLGAKQGLSVRAISKGIDDINPDRGHLLLVKDENPQAATIGAAAAVKSPADSKAQADAEKQIFD